MENRNGKERACTFAVITNTGECPNCQINIAGFDEPDGMAVTTQIRGKGQDIVILAMALVEHLIEDNRESGVDSEAAFLAILGQTITEKASEEGLMRCQEMIEERKQIMEELQSDPVGALRKLVEKLEEMQSSESEFEAEEED